MSWLTKILSTFCGAETNDIESVDKPKHEDCSQITNENRGMVSDKHVKSVEVGFDFLNFDFFSFNSFY
jgi:hypothetical protein